MKLATALPEGMNLGSLHSYKGLGVLPVLLPDSKEQIDYLTLDEALADGRVRITEINEGGNVPELLLENSADKPVLLVDGEELVGAKQNRTLNLTILAPANQKTVIPVSCVESGRWNYTSDEFRNSDRTHFARGRARKMASVSASMADSGTRRSNQGEVWADIDMKFSRMQMMSETSAMADLYEASGATLQGYVDAFQALSNQAGAFFFLGEELVGFDVFDKPETFARLFQKLLRSYAIDAVEEAANRPSTPSADKAEALIESLSSADWHRYPATGLGTDFRLQSSRVTAASLVVDDIVVHASGFLLSAGQTGPSETGMASLRRRRRMRMH